MGRRSVEITHPHKVIFPSDGVTKGDLIEYYGRIAPWILPYLRNRPLAIERYPGGLGVRGFFQQKASDYFPDWIETATVPKEDGTVRHVLCNDAATLIYLANQAMVTPHVWLSRIDDPDRPDQLIFDLDPSGAEFSSVVAAARCVREILDSLALPAYVKTTGSRGLHVAVPLKRREEYQSVRSFARMLAEVAVARGPDRWTIEQRKNKRRERVYIDTNRNAYGQTIAPAYAVRARPGAPVSVPIGWEELESRRLLPDRWTIRDVFRKLESCDDPWEHFFRRACSLDRARAKLEEIHAAERIPKEEKVRRDTRTGGRAA